MDSVTVVLVTITLLLGSTFGGIIDADILRILASSQSNGYYVVSPVHFLPASVLSQNFLQFPKEVEQKKEDERPTIDDGELTPPKEEYGPPKDEYGPPMRESNSEYIPPRKEYGPPMRESNSEYIPPRKEYGPPMRESNSEYIPPRMEYGPPRREYGPPMRMRESMSSGFRPIPPPRKMSEYLPPKSEYGPPKQEYGPPPKAQETVIFKSYIEPTFSFGEFPLQPFADTSSQQIAEAPRKSQKQGY